MDDAERKARKRALRRLDRELEQGQRFTDEQSAARTKRLTRRYLKKSP